MPLTCSCFDDDYDDDPVYWVWHPDGYQEMPKTSRRHRCASCGILINRGDTVARFDRTRYARNDIELAIHGEGEEAIVMAPKWLCETCADLYFSLTELGYCVYPEENMRGLVKEYAASNRAASQVAHDNPTTNRGPDHV